MNLRQFTSRFAKPFWHLYLIGAIFLALTNYVTLKIPQIAKNIVNRLEAQENLDSAVELAIAIIALGFIQVLVRSLSRIFIFWPGRRIEEKAKSKLFSITMQLPQSFFDRFGMGDLISRISNDLGQLRVFFAFGILQILNMSFLGIFTLYMMLQVHVKLTLLCLLPISAMLFLTKFVMPKLAKFSRANQDAIGRLTNRVTEAFSNTHVLKANSAEEAFLGKIELENQQVYETNMKVIVFRTVFFPLLTSLTGLAHFVVIGYGGFQVIEKNISIGDILAFNIYLSYLAFPLTSIGIILSIYQRSKTALQRIDPIFKESPEAGTARIEDKTFEQDEALLEIRGLSYQYPQAQSPSLQNIDLIVEKGDKIGICGAVGSGKTSIFRLITRIYDPDKKQIFWKGRDITEILPAQLREQIGYATQEVHLFSESIENNLRFGLDDRKISKEELRQACANAQVLGDIDGFEKGFETQIGEKGIKLSGGQKQRLALARIFLRPYELLLLDDVFSAVDTQTEAQLINYLNSSQKTFIVSSHRASVLKTCDHVIILKNGHILDTGTYTQLALRHPELNEETQL